MAIVIARIGDQTFKLAGTVVADDVYGGVWLHDFRPEPMFIHQSQIVEVKTLNTMRVHCFYCWNDATHYHQVEVCLDHAPEGAPQLMHRFKPGMNDD